MEMLLIIMAAGGIALFVCLQLYILFSFIASGILYDYLLDFVGVKKWPTTQGRVVAIDVNEKKSGQYKGLTELKVEYRYSINGKEYRNGSIHAGRNQFSNTYSSLQKAKHDQLVFAPGNATVYYCKRNPAYSALNPNPIHKGGMWSLALATLFCGGIFYMIFWPALLFLIAVFDELGFLISKLSYL